MRRYLLLDGIGLEGVLAVGTAVPKEIIVERRIKENSMLDMWIEEGY